MTVIERGSSLEPRVKYKRAVRYRGLVTALCHGPLWKSLGCLGVWLHPLRGVRGVGRLLSVRGREIIEADLFRRLRGLPQGGVRHERLAERPLRPVQAIRLKVEQQGVRRIRQETEVHNYPDAGGEGVYPSPLQKSLMQKIYDETFSEDEEGIEAYADFVAIVRQLRRDCPWDREQTHESVKHLLIEEAYETVEAIDEKNWEALRKELGDILLHVVFHSAIAEQAGEFRLIDVIRSESEKLVRRHPHVFGETAVSGVGEVLSNWEKIKLTEGEKRSTLAGVPRHLPALLRAQRMQEKAAGVGFDFPEQMGAWQKVEEELAELRRTIEGGAPPEEKEGEFGDLLFALVNYARFAEITPENALGRSNDKFQRRFQHIERCLAEQGLTFSDVDLAEMDRYWDEAKALEQA